VPIFRPALSKINGMGFVGAGVDMR